MNVAFLSKIFQYILLTSRKFSIDESHGISHSMNVLHYAEKIYQSELPKHPILKQQKNIVYISALLHDMCDKKYVSEEAGLADLENFLIPVKRNIMPDSGCEIAGPGLGGFSKSRSEVSEISLNDDPVITPNELTVIKQIISTMSYSKVKRDGYPILGAYEIAYHIVREADLLAAYDFDRCMIYDMNRNKHDLESAFHHADELFKKRVLKHNEDKLFVTEYSQNLSKILHKNALKRMNAWRNIISG